MGEVETVMPSIRITRLLATTGLATVLLTGTAVAKTDLVVGMNLEPPHLDPTGGAAAAIDEVVLYNVFETLTRIGPDGSIGPGLAESWEVSDDGLVYTFRLREGVSFHDGTGFDSEDVAFSYNRARAEDSANSQRAYFAPIDTIETPDPYTVVITLREQDGLFLFRMGVGDASIVAPESADTNTTNPIGTGPYRFADRVEGDRVILVRNEAYVGPDAVYFDSVTFRFITDAAAQVAAVRAGDVDVFPNIGSPESVLAFEADPRFATMVGSTEGETVMALNWRRAPFDDPRVRQAIAHAIDRDAVVEGAMFGFGTPIGTHFAPHHPAYLDLTDLYPHDPARAAELLAEAGYADGLELEFMLPPPAAYARRGGEVIQAQLAEVGIDADLVPVEWGQWLEQAFRGFDYDMTIVSHTEALDIGIYARGENYYFGYVNPAFNAVIEELNRTSDEAERTALYQQAQRIIGEDLASIFVFQLAKTGVRRTEVQGMWENAPIQANDVTAARWVD